MITRKLPVLDAVFQAAKIPSMPKMQKILFVCVQHLLYTTIDLFEALVDLGAIPHNIFFIGKHYSACSAVAEKIHSMGIQLQKLTPLKLLGDYSSIFNQDVLNMWQKVQTHINQHDIEAVIVLDDGGRCLEFITQGILRELPVIGIEQTTAGLFNPAVINLHVPFIDVAACAAKIHLESDLVVEVILDKLSDVLSNEMHGLACGVVGVGVIGKAVAKQLILLGYKVYLYDQNSENYDSIQDAAAYCSNLEELIQQVDYIFGCTGRDITANIVINDVIKHDKVFISCTSEDKEFLTLLKSIQATSNYSNKFNPLKDIKWKLPNGATINMIKGGFPINFDDSGESVPATKIQLTRGLLLAALIQAVSNISHLQKTKIKGRIMLRPEVQKLVVEEWFKVNKNHKFSRQLVDKFKNIDWIIANSGGLLCDSSYIKQYFTNDEYEKETYEVVN